MTAETTVSNLDWSGGSIGGGGMLTVTGLLNISGAGAKGLGGGLLRNTGTALWTGSGNIQFGDGSVFDNAGTFEAQNDAQLVSSFGASSTLSNRGLFKKTFGPGTTTIAVVFDNSGVLDAASGQVLLAGGGTSSGVINASNNAQIVCSTDYACSSGAAFTGPGLKRFVGGTVTLSGAISAQNLEWGGGGVAGAMVLGGGKVFWSSGWLVGQVTNSNNAELDITGDAGKGMLGAVLHNAGTVIWTGSGNISFVGGSLFENNGTLEVQGDAGLRYNFGAASTLHNAGLLKKTGGAGATTIDSGLLFTNEGTVQLDKGTLSCLGDYNQSGRLRIGVSGTAAGLMYGWLEVQGTARLAGVFDFFLLPGYRPVAGDTFQVLAYGARLGSFSTISGLDLGFGTTLTAVYTAQNLVLATTESLTNRVVVTAFGSGGMALRYTGLPGMDYVIQASSTLSPGGWASLFTNHTASGLIDYLDTGTTNRPYRFYRAQRLH